MDEINLDLKLSSVRVGSKSNPRLVWSLGVEKSFLELIAPEMHKVKLEQQNGQLLAKLGTEGVKISSSVKGNWAWANNLGVHHIMGMKTPEDEMPAQHLKGGYNPHSQQIRFTSDLPQVVLNSFLDMDAARLDADPETHFPGTHFVEDIQQEQRADSANLDDPEEALAWLRLVDPRVI